MHISYQKKCIVFVLGTLKSHVDMEAAVYFQRKILFIQKDITKLFWSFLKLNITNFISDWKIIFQNLENPCNIIKHGGYSINTLCRSNCFDRMLMKIAKLSSAKCKMTSQLFIVCLNSHFTARFCHKGVIFVINMNTYRRCYTFGPKNE